MDLLGMTIAENRREAKLTVLHRPDGTWGGEEVSRLVSRLMTDVCGHPRQPEYIILLGHYTKEEALAAIMGGQSFTATQVIGVDNKTLPFRPSFF